MKHWRLALSGILSLVLLLLSFPQGLFAAQLGLGTGLKEPTTAQKQWINEFIPVVQNVRLNGLALERINQERAQKGMPELKKRDLDISAIGDELVWDASQITGIAVTALPGTVDNSASAAFPPIRSQGSLGSCAAWATTYYQFTYENNLARGRAASGGDNNVIFSPKWTYNMVNGGANAGSYFSDCYNLELKHGAATWSQFPYDSNYLAWDLDPAVWRSALNYRPLAMGQLYNSNVDTLISDIKTQLANGHVLVIGTYVSSWVQKTLSNDPAVDDDNGYVGQKIASYMSNTASGGHAMTMVGYNDALWVDLNGNGIVESAEKGAFKIANSWGTSDWNSGFRWVSYDALRTTSAVSSTGVWPTTNRASGGIFWNGNIFTLTASANYSPTMVAQITLNQAKRNQIALSLGIAAPSLTQPSTAWNTAALKNSGGAYAFDGTTVNRDGTFVLDFSDLAASSVGNTRWFIGLADNAVGYPSIIKDFQLYQVTASGDTRVGTAGNVPQSAESGKVYTWVDYAANSLNQAPVAAFTATTTSGTNPLTVNFDATASNDPDGQIVTYNWNFGDGATAGAATASHIFTAARSYTVTLTVADDRGASSSKSITITVLDPVSVKAPTNLSSKLSRTKVTLSWIDNANNESGFYIERSTLSTSGYSNYSVVGQTIRNTKTFSQTVALGTYKYRVRAFNSSAASAYSNEITVQVK
jgi:PKD repeat protein